MQDVEDATLNVCDQQDRTACDFVGKSCETCTKRKREDIHPYVYMLLGLRNMREMGFQIAPEVLSEEQWLDLVLVENAIIGARKKARKKGTR